MRPGGGIISLSHYYGGQYIAKPHTDPTCLKEAQKNLGAIVHLILILKGAKKVDQNESSLSKELKGYQSFSSELFHKIVSN